jgi:subtilase family serine protease
MNCKKDNSAPDDRRWQSFIFVVATVLAAGLATNAIAASGQFIARNTAPYVSSAKNLGTEDPNKVIEVSIWLHPHNRTEMDALARDLYNAKSPNYRHFLNSAQFAARFAPTAVEARTVQDFFTAHNLQVVRVGSNNFFVRARGTVADVQTAFHVVLNNYRVGGKVVRSNDRDPYVEGEAASLVSAVTGLDTGKFEHPLMGRTTALPGAAQGVAANSALTPDFFTSNCFNGIETEKETTNNDGEFPIGNYKGNHLNLQTLTSAGCAYTPPAIQTAYNLTGLYTEGFNGAGQTIGIIDWCGSSTIQNDANVFSAKFGLPLLGSSNFSIIYTPTQSLCISADQVEINIDVEWAHAIAPGANIALIVPPSASFQDVNEAEFNAVNYGWANVLSGSYGSVESFTPASVLATENLINEMAAIAGISANFSSGDSGDFTIDGIPATVLAPADSPWATAVGGVSLALKSDNSIAWQSGWGNNQTLFSEEGFVFDPPLAFGFIGGAGGGPSNCATQDSLGDCLAGFPKPSYQSKLPGKNRLLPDVSWLADPYTGAVIAITVPGQVPPVVYQVWGGTSLACPMFAGLWAIANEEAEAGGGAPLGLAAPYMYNLPAGAVFDIVPVGSANNVVAKIQESPTTITNYTAAQVMGVNPSTFFSAIWDYPYDAFTVLAISFGTDSGLHTNPGWDNVTGVGTPNAQAFADSFKTPRTK